MLLGMKTDVATLEISVEVSQKAQNQITTMGMTQLYHFWLAIHSKDSISYT